MIHKLTSKHDDKKKEAFYASDYGKSNLELYFAFTGEPKTNPVLWQDTLRMGAGKGAEEAMLKVLKDSGVVAPSYTQEEGGRVEMERLGVPIHGYIDALTVDGEPIEIKTVNNKNVWDIKRYENRTPRENYVGQLAVYMDFLGASKGHLFVASIDGLNTFWFDCDKILHVYQCGKTRIELNKEYERWAKLYEDYILIPRLPDIWEKRYKYPLKDIDWTKVSIGDISKARNGHKVLGDWEVLYSPWKNRIIELQGETVGYTPEELEFIREKTKGYSSKI